MQTSLQLLQHLIGEGREVKFLTYIRSKVRKLVKKSFFKIVSTIFDADCMLIQANICIILQFSVRN